MTGATGLIGTHLCASLQSRGDHVVVLSRRRPVAAVTAARILTWDAYTEPIPEEALEGADAIVNLAGESLSTGRWTRAQRDLIIKSRLTATRRCAAASTPTRALISASAIGVYGPGEAPVDESAEPGDDFLAHVCRSWETEAMAGQERGARVVCLRTGLVLARDGGVLPRLVGFAKWGLGGRMGSGKQWQSWIHIDDEVAIILHAIDSDVVGPLNATAPNPVRQREFARTLGQAIHRPMQLPAPALALRLILGGPASLALEGQRVVPQTMLKSGFRFRYETLEPALLSLLRS